MAKYENTAKEILEKVGGEKNIVSATHCMTRLRLVLRDDSIVDPKKVEAIDGVMGTMNKGGQFQIIIGNNVAACYKELTKIANVGGEASAADLPKEKKPVVDTVLDFIAGSMSPLLGPIIAGGLIKVLLVLLGSSALNVLDSASDTYIILTALGDAPFYFLPILLGYTAAAKLNTNKFLTASVCAFLVYPDLVTLLGTAESVSLFGFLPVVQGSYSSSVLPALLAALLVKYVEIGVDKITPEWTKNFLKPLLIYLVAGTITLLVLAPLGVIVGSYLNTAINAVYSFAPWLALGLAAAFMPFIVMTGMHWALVPTALIALANPGYETLLCPGMLCSNLAQGAACVAFALKVKNKGAKEIAVPSGISALLAGVTEPAMYGITLKYKKPMMAACIGGGIAGVFAGFVQLKGYAFATPSLLAIVQFISPDGGSNFMYAIITAAISIVITFVLTLVLTPANIADPETSDSGNDEAAVVTVDVEPEAPAGAGSAVLKSPVQGKFVPLSQVNDPTFASGIMGLGYACVPSKGQIVAPFDGTVGALLDSHHAVGINSKDGVQLLVHVGLETVNLKGKHFSPKVAMNDSFKAGDVLLEFDIDAIKGEGYDITTPVIVLNTPDYSAVNVEERDTISFGDEAAKLEK